MQRFNFTIGFALACAICLAMVGCGSASSTSSSNSSASAASNSIETATSASSASASSENASQSQSSTSSQTIDAFDPGKAYQQGDMAKFSGYSLGGQTTQDQNTGKKGAVIFFATSASASADDAQAIIMLDTVRALDAGTPVQCTAVCALIGDDGKPIFTEL